LIIAYLELKYVDEDHLVLTLVLVFAVLDKKNVFRERLVEWWSEARENI